MSSAKPACVSKSIGKLHYRDADSDTGFKAQHVPMHVVDGVGDLLGCVREPLPPRWKARELAEKIGPGETSYTRYDRTVRDETVAWLGSGPRMQPLATDLGCASPRW